MVASVSAMAAVRDHPIGSLTGCMCTRHDLRVGGVVAREVPALLAIGCGDLGANVLFGLASSAGQVSVASVLGSLYPVVTILLARALLKERLRRVQQVGAALSLVGAGIIAF